MYQLIFTIIVITNGKFGFQQTMLHSFDREEHCIEARNYVQKELQKESGQIAGFLECRRTI